MTLPPSWVKFLIVFFFIGSTVFVRIGADQRQEAFHDDYEAIVSSKTRTRLLRPVDINRANRKEIEALPGIGPVLADEIIYHRDQSGPYKKPADLLVVRGIGPKKLSRIKPYLLFSSSERQALSDE